MKNHSEIHRSVKIENIACIMFCEQAVICFFFLDFAGHSNGDSDPPTTQTGVLEAGMCVTVLLIAELYINIL